MNTHRTDLAKLPPLPATPEFASAPDADDEDADWLEFLSIGMRLDPADALPGSGWRHAPVLLSY